jgi:uncharacterized protein YggE
MRRLLSVAPLALLAALAAPAYAGSITIEGHGEVRAAPDMAIMTSGVTTQGATAREALDANSAAMTDLLDTLKAAEIEARDIQTSGFSVTPNYVYSEERDENGYTLPPRIDGYQVSNTVTVTIRDLATLGDILDKAVAVGANTVNGISFSVADPTEILNEARKNAFADARAKAELYAELAGSSLDQLVSISETQNFNQPPPYPMFDRAVAQSAAAVPVEAGEMAFSVNVNIQWELDDSTN